MIKSITLCAKDDDVTAHINEEEKISALRPDLGKKKSSYYAVCTNFWANRETAEFTLCTFTEPLGDFSSYKEAKAVLDTEYNGKKKCPYCGFRHFRASSYEDLVFDNDNASSYFNIE